MTELADNQTALADRIVALMAEAKMPEPVRTLDIQNRRNLLGRTYAENHIRTVLPNFCTPNGYHVKRGLKARFRRQERGRYMRFSN
jgi:hypothetical protein